MGRRAAVGSKKKRKTQGTQRAAALLDELRSFNEFGKRTLVSDHGGLPIFVNEFWTARQRAAHSLHEVSYRACFKPQLPRFFIERLTDPGDLVHDPFMGRGTTELEAALLARRAAGADINPLATLLVAPRLRPPTLDAIKSRLDEIDLSFSGSTPAGFGVFFSPKTLREICALRGYLLRGERSGSLDEVDQFIRMVAINRLTGHSPGFFSVYTLPPNQAATIDAQRKINRKRNQRPGYRDVRALIVRKSAALLKDLTAKQSARLAALPAAQLLTADSADTPEIRRSSVDLVVTSPPFLDIVDYKADNWLRCWFAGIDPASVSIAQLANVDAWRRMIHGTLVEQARVLRPGGFVAFEVGEIRGGKVQLEDEVLIASECSGLKPICVMINAQRFTKTSHLWGIKNQKRGTNTNRIVVFQK